MRDQIPIVIDNFMGLFDRGPNENCPVNYFTNCKNIEYIFKGFRTRGEFLSEYNFTAVSANILGLYIYPRLDGTQRRLVLVRQVGGGDPVKLYDIDHPTAAPFLVATYTTDIDAISPIVLFDRFYFAPLLQDGEHGTDEIVAVYNGTDAARDAGGLAPAGATMTTSEPGAGFIEAGLHLFAVAFETPSGYITRPGPATWTHHTASGLANAQIDGILLGPAGTVARHILATKVLTSAYTDPQENYELFFVPNGRIADNVTTSLIVDFFDTELLSSADYLNYQLEEIPAGPLFSIGNSMGIAGYRETDNDDRSVALISRPNEVESFTEDEDYIIAKPGYGGSLYNGLDLNGTLYLFKKNMTLIVQPDWAVPPIDWQVGVVDSINGTGPFGIGTYNGIPFIVEGGAAVLTQAGLQFFNGGYTNLSEVIDERWEAATGRNFNRSMCVVDPVQRRVYMILAASTGNPDTFLVADYKLGFSKDLIRWSPWEVKNMVFRAMMNDRTGALRLTNTSEQIVQYIERSALTTEDIDSYIDTALLRYSQLGHICQFAMLLIGAEGVGPLELTWKGKDDVKTEVLPNIDLTTAPGKLMKRLCNFTSEMARLHLETNHANQAGSYMSINSIRIFGNIFAEELPE